MRRRVTNIVLREPKGSSGRDDRRRTVHRKFEQRHRDGLAVGRDESPPPALPARPARAARARARRAHVAEAQLVEEWVAHGLDGTRPEGRRVDEDRGEEVERFGRGVREELQRPER